MNLVGIYYHHSNHLPIVCDIPSQDKFIQVCEYLPTDWAHLVNMETGEILHTWRNFIFHSKTKLLSAEQSINRTNRK